MELSRKQYQELKEKERILKEAAKAINIQPEELPKAIRKFQKEIEQLEERKKKLEKVSLADLKNKIKSTDEMEFLIEKIPGATMADLMEISNELKKENRVLVLAGVTESGVRVLGKAGKLVVKRGINITEILKRSISIIDGEVSGDEYQSKGGGPRVKKVHNFLKKCEEEIEDRITYATKMNNS